MHSKFSRLEEDERGVIDFYYFLCGLELWQMLWVVRGNDIVKPDWIHNKRITFSTKTGTAMKLEKL